MFDPGRDGVDADDFRAALQSLTHAGLTRDQTTCLFHALVDSISREPDVKLTVEALLGAWAGFCFSLPKRAGQAPAWVQGQVRLIRSQLQAKAKLKEVYALADASSSGLVPREALERMLAGVVDVQLVATAGQVPTSFVARDIARFLDWNDSGKVSFAEFVLGLHVGGSGSLRSCLLEPICVEMYKNRTPLLAALRKYDDNGYIMRENFVTVLVALGEALREQRREEALTKLQVERLAENLSWVDGKLDYEAFLKSFCVVDTGRMSECASSGWHLLQAAFSPAMHSNNGACPSTTPSSFASLTGTPTACRASPNRSPVMSPGMQPSRPHVSGSMLDVSRAMEGMQLRTDRFGALHRTSSGSSGSGERGARLR